MFSVRCNYVSHKFFFYRSCKCVMTFCLWVVFAFFDVYRLEKTALRPYKFPSKDLDVEEYTKTLLLFIITHNKILSQPLRN